MLVRAGWGLLGFGVLFLILGYVLVVPIMVTLGWVGLVVGAVLLVIGYVAAGASGPRARL